MAPQNDKFRLLRRIPDLRFEEVSKGYSKEQVNRVLDNLAQLYEEVERLQARLAEAETRAASAEARLVEARSPSNAADSVPPLPNADFDETLRNTLVSAQRTADTMVKEAKEEATRVQSEAELQSSALLDDARAQSEEMTAEAVAHRDKLMSEADEERVEVTRQYKDELDERKKSIETELDSAHEAERSSLLKQISSLQGVHQTLQDDIGRFESHLDSRREAIRSAITDLTKVVEDPSSLRSTEQPEPAEVAEVHESDYPKIGIESPLFDELDGQVSDGDSSAEEVPTPDPDAEVTVSADELASTNGSPTVVVNEDDDTVEAAPEVEEATSGSSDPQEFSEDVTLDRELDQDVVEPEQQPVDAETTIAGSGGVAASGGDPFLAELRRVTNEEPKEGDPITDFLEDESPNSNSGGWFGRRK